VIFPSTYGPIIGYPKSTQNSAYWIHRANYSVSSVPSPYAKVSTLFSKLKRTSNTHKCMSHSIAFPPFQFCSDLYISEPHPFKKSRAMAYLSMLSIYRRLINFCNNRLNLIELPSGYRVTAVAQQTQ